MNYLIAKVKGRQKPDHFKLISDISIFSIELNPASAVEYEPDHNLDEDCWFKVSNFKEKPFCPDFIKNNLGSTDFNQIPSSKYSEILYLCSIQSLGFCFQKITPSLYVNKPLICFGENVSIEESGKKIFINPTPDAIYMPTQNVLLFKNLATISSIFKGIDILYKEATQEEVQSFLNEPFISLGSNYTVEAVSKPNRKRIALAIESLAGMDVEDRHQVFEYIHTYCENINYDANQKKFTVNDDDQMKFLLYGIEQRFYTTPFSHERRLANSILKLS